MCRNFWVELLQNAKKQVEHSFNYAHFIRNEYCSMFTTVHVTENHELQTYSNESTDFAVFVRLHSFHFSPHFEISWQNTGIVVPHKSVIDALICMRGRSLDCSMLALHVKGRRIDSNSPSFLFFDVSRKHFRFSCHFSEKTTSKHIENIFCLNTKKINTKKGILNFCVKFWCFFLQRKVPNSIV